VAQQNCRSEIKSNYLLQLLTVPEDPVTQVRQSKKTVYSDSDRRQRSNGYTGTTYASTTYVRYEDLITHPSNIGQLPWKLNDFSTGKYGNGFLFISIY